MSDYECVARVIRHLDQRRGRGREQPGLEELARAAGCSPARLRRAFLEWGGLSLEKFLECLSLVHVRECLACGRSALEEVPGSARSGAGRSTGAAVQWEFALAGERKPSAAKWTLSAGFAQSPFGTCFVAAGPRGICHLSLLEPGAGESAWDELREEWPGTRLERDDARAGELTARVFRRPGGAADGQSLRVFVRGTAFRVRVWQAMLRVPRGGLVSYAQLASSLGMSSAARAVGSAVAANPLAYVIPCHRVIRQTGALGEYRWGWERKRAMLAWEAVGAA